MSFTSMQKNERPGAPTDKVELAMDSLAADPERFPEYQAALECIHDTRWSNPQIAQAFRDLGFTDIDANRVKHYRRKIREGTLRP